MKVSFFLLSSAALTFVAGTSLAADYYVAPSGNDSNPGTEAKPWKTINKANSSLQPGDTVYLHGGRYDGQTIEPSRSGTSQSNRIIYKAYPGERPIIRRTKVGLILANKDYITIDGIDMDGEIVRGKYGSWPGIGNGSSNIQNFALIDNSSHNIIQNVFWQKAHGWGGVKLSNKSRYNKLLNSTFDFVGTYDNGSGNDSGDVIQFEASAEHNLLEGSTLKHGGHNLIEVAGRYNVIRNNVFNNDWSDYLGGDKGNRGISLKGEGPSNYTGGYNLVEGNIIRSAKKAIDDWPAAAKVIGEGQIVRRNFFYDNSRFGIVTANGSGASNGYVSKNRIFHNVFHKPDGSAWTLSWNDKNGKSLDDNIFKNNIIHMARMNPEKAALDAEIIFKSATDSLRDNKVIANLFFHSEPGDGRVYCTTHGKNKSLSEYERLEPANFSKNVQKDPKWRASTLSTKADFQLSSISPAIDAGDFLTQTRSSGSGTRIPVKDAHYFTDGFGIVPGDEIKVGQQSPVRIVRVDYASQELTVDRTVSWSGGDQVSLNFSGAAPDIGAFEHGLDRDSSSNVLTPPMPPQSLEVIIR